jgi:hypothetical protein
LPCEGTMYWIGIWESRKKLAKECCPLFIKTTSFCSHHRKAGFLKRPLGAEGFKIITPIGKKIPLDKTNPGMIPCQPSAKPF